MKSYPLYISDGLKSSFRTICEEQGISMNAQIKTLILDFCTKYHKANPPDDIILTEEVMILKTQFSEMKKVIQKLPIELTEELRGMKKMLKELKK